MKRKWEDTTEVEELLISVIDELYYAWVEKNDETIQELFEIKEQILEENFNYRPAEQAANDSHMENKSA